MKIIYQIEMLFVEYYHLTEMIAKWQIKTHCCNTKEETCTYIYQQIHEGCIIKSVKKIIDYGDNNIEEFPLGTKEFPDHVEIWGDE